MFHTLERRFDDEFGRYPVFIAADWTGHRVSYARRLAWLREHFIDVLSMAVVTTDSKSKKRGKKGRMLARDKRCYFLGEELAQNRCLVRRENVFHPSLFCRCFDARKFRHGVEAKKSRLPASFASSHLLSLENKPRYALSERISRNVARFQ